ncbi:MAG: hypothetical protein IJ194_02755 [Bacilli bacterium]|nr:hypothetical protein [Bacilli bacterium]
MLENHNNDNTTTSFTATQNAMSFRSKWRRIKKIILSFLLICLLVVGALFFTLPCFQTSNAKVNGLVNFSLKDLLYFSENEGYHPNAFLDCKRSEEKVLSASKGLIRECSFISNGFTLDIQVKEDHPLAQYKDEKYFVSGISLKDYNLALGETTLSQERKQEISLLAKQECEDSLPILHLPKNLSFQDVKTNALSIVSRIPFSSLIHIKHFEFVNKNEDARWDNVARVLLSDGENDYLISNLLSDELSTYFTPNDDFFPKSVFNSLSHFVKKETLEKKTFRFEDEEEERVAYCFRFMITSVNGVKTIRIQKD